MSLDKITLEIITNPIDWNGVLQEIGDFDFYHTFEYHLIEVKEDETTADPSTQGSQEKKLD